MADQEKQFFPMPGLHSSIIRFEKLFESSEKFDHILIRGPRGAGKSYFIQKCIKRKTLPKDIVHVNCATIYPHLADSELFGHAKGAFTGATGSSLGLIGKAKHHKVMILEELNSLPEAIQAKLLVFMETFFYYQLGSPEKKDAKVRLIATRNYENKEDVRNDLLDRFRIIVDVPPLHLRRDDILYYIGKKHPSLALGHYTLLLLYNHSWPGNLRDLDRFLLELNAGVPRGEYGPLQEGLFEKLKECKFYNKIKFKKNYKGPKFSELAWSFKVRLINKGTPRSIKNAPLRDGMPFEMWETSDYETPEIVVLGSKNEEVGTIASSEIRKFFQAAYGEYSIYSDKPIHLFEKEINSDLQLGQLDIPNIAKYLGSNNGSLPQLLREIINQHGHGGKSRLAEMLGVKPQTISRWINKEIIPS